MNYLIQNKTTVQRLQYINDVLFNHFIFWCCSVYDCAEFENKDSLRLLEDVALDNGCLSLGIMYYLLHSLCFLLFFVG